MGAPPGMRQIDYILQYTSELQTNVFTYTKMTGTLLFNQRIQVDNL